MISKQKQQLNDLRIRHRMAVFAFEGQEPPQAQKDIDFLLSLVKSQEAGSATPFCPVHKALEERDGLVLEVGNDCVASSEPWRDEGGHVWEQRPNVECVECPHCCFIFSAVHTDGYSDGYSCPNCKGCPDVASTAAIRDEPDLIAFKWAETLSQGEQDVMLTSSLRRLQNMINNAVAATTPPSTRAKAAAEILKTVDDAIIRVGASANCYDVPADANSGAEYVAMRVRQTITRIEEQKPVVAEIENLERFYFLDSHSEEAFVRESDHKRVIAAIIERCFSSVDQLTEKGSE